MPTIIVKKSDGTFSSVPLDQLKKGVDNPPTKNMTQNPALSPSLPPAKDPGSATPAVHEVSQKTGTSAKLTAQDFTSPLEEKLDTSKFSPIPAKSFADSHVENVLSSLRFSVPKDYENRLRTVVQLMIKQVRTDEQTKEVSRRPLAAGGLALSDSQAEELVRVGHEELNKMHPEYGVDLPATTTPFNSLKHESVVSKTPRMSPLLSSSRQNKVSSILESATPQRRPVMADVTLKPVAVGPIEELRTSTLTDVRRLAPIAKDAFARFGQKFVNIKNESVLFFFEARDAYRSGVIFEEYTAILLKALAEENTLEKVVENAGSWKIEELRELIHMEKSLNL